MTGALKDRRRGKDRRHQRKPPPGTERRACDRRQFPPHGNGEPVSVSANRLGEAIDQYKKAHSLSRISLDQLLSVLTQLGYRAIQ
ncbi:MAG: hypothetical protein FJ288_18215 [Planctomycetes bacterium]|nr:hypothetical protein [Planctomycetota bacterium]